MEGETRPGRIVKNLSKKQLLFQQYQRTHHKYQARQLLLQATLSHSKEENAPRPIPAVPSTRSVLEQIPQHENIQHLSTLKSGGPLSAARKLRDNAATATLLSVKSSIEQTLNKAKRLQEKFQQSVREPQAWSRILQGQNREGRQSQIKKDQLTKYQWMLELATKKRPEQEAASRMNQHLGKQFLAQTRPQRNITRQQEKAPIQKSESTQIRLNKQRSSLSQFNYSKKQNNLVPHCLAKVKTFGQQELISRSVAEESRLKDRPLTVDELSHLPAKHVNSNAGTVAQAYNLIIGDKNRVKQSTAEQDRPRENQIEEKNEPVRRKKVEHQLESIDKIQKARGLQKTMSLFVEQLELDRAYRERRNQVPEEDWPGLGLLLQQEHYLYPQQFQLQEGEYNPGVTVLREEITIAAKSIAELFRKSHYHFELKMRNQLSPEELDNLLSRLDRYGEGKLGARELVRELNLGGKDFRAADGLRLARLVMREGDLSVTSWRKVFSKYK